MPKKIEITIGDNRKRARVELDGSGDAQLPCSSTEPWQFTIVEEDDTIGNLVHKRLNRYPDVTFAGYRKTHISVQEISIKVQTTGERTPAEALHAALSDILVELEEIGEQYRIACSLNSSLPDNVLMADDGGCTSALQSSCQTAE